jgi:hypothetical protein
MPHTFPRIDTHVRRGPAGGSERVEGRHAESGSGGIHPPHCLEMILSEKRAEPSAPRRFCYLAFSSNDLM